MNKHEAERLCDLMKQGLATFKAPKPIRKKAAAPTVSCHACLNWHPENKHTADATTRKANLKACGLSAKDAQERIK